MALDHPSDLTLAQQLAAVQGWWRDAGVDCAFLDEPQAMLRPREEVAVPAPVRIRAAPVEPEAEPAIARINIMEMPLTLSGFCDWWCDPATPLPLPSGPRLAPIGGEGARLLLLAPMPEPEDTDELFSGRQGRLLRNMLDALEVDEEDAYFATALPTAMELPDWEGLAQAGFDTIIAHHIALVAPARVLVLGSSLAPLLKQVEAPVLGSFSPDQLLAHPRQCARLWARLLDWMPDE